MQSVNFRQYATKDPKLTCYYRGVIQSTPNHVHTLTCKSLQQINFLDQYLSYFPTNGSTHCIRFSYQPRYQQGSKDIEIFHFEIDLGSELIWEAKKKMVFNLEVLKKALEDIDSCASYVCQSVAATADSSEDWKLIKLDRKQIVERKITKPIYYLEDGRIDLEKYWLLIVEKAYSNCPYKNPPIGRVEGIILD